MKTNQLRIALIFIWIGFICAISFMEAWLKFTAPGVTLLTGLSIGKVVFSALNKVEIALSAFVIVTIVLEGGRGLKNIKLLIPIVILIIQTAVLLPQLSQRISIYLEGGTPESSNLHSIYVLCEIIKVVALAWYGIMELKNLIRVKS